MIGATTILVTMTDGGGGKMPLAPTVTDYSMTAINRGLTVTVVTWLTSEPLQKVKLLASLL